MGNTESGLIKVCRSRTLKKSTNIQSTHEPNDESDEEEQMEDIDDGVLIEKNRDNYFNREDAEQIIRKFPEYKDWQESLMSSSRQKPKHKRIKWKEGEMIGNGSFGKVVMGLDLQTGSIMAVKQVQIGLSNTPAQQERIKALEIEIELLSQLSHKNIVQYCGSHRTKTTFNIFLEYISGGTIASLIEKYGPLNENLIRVYTRQILEGLEYLHVRNTMHRDIKGANVLVDNSGVCKLADFGTAKRISTIVDGELKCMPSIRGTPNWMAPEVIKQSTLGRFSDIWSLGCTVLEMATGKIPWSNLMKGDANAVSALYQIAKAKSHPPLPEKPQPRDNRLPEAMLCLLFRINPAERPNVIKLLNHKFILGIEQIEKSIPLVDEEKLKSKNKTKTRTSKHKNSDSLVIKVSENPDTGRPKSSYSKPRKESKQDSYVQLDESLRPTSEYFGDKRKNEPKTHEIKDIRLSKHSKSDTTKPKDVTEDDKKKSAQIVEETQQKEKPQQSRHIPKLVLLETANVPVNADYTTKVGENHNEIKGLKSERNASNPEQNKPDYNNLPLPEDGARAIKSQEKSHKRFNFSYVPQHMPEMSPKMDDSTRYRYSEAGDGHRLPEAFRNSGIYKASDTQRYSNVTANPDFIRTSNVHRNSDSAAKSDIPVVKLRRRTRPLGRNDHTGSFRHLGQSQVGEEEFSSINISTLGDITQNGNGMDPTPRKHIRNRSLFSIKDLNVNAEREAKENEERKIDEQAENEGEGKSALANKRKSSLEEARIQEIGYKTPESKQREQKHTESQGESLAATPNKDKFNSRQCSDNKDIQNISDIMDVNEIEKALEGELAIAQKKNKEAHEPPMRSIAQTIQDLRIDEEPTSQRRVEEDDRTHYLDDIQLTESVLMTKRGGRDVEEMNHLEKLRTFQVKGSDFIKTNPFTQNTIRPRTLNERTGNVPKDEDSAMLHDIQASIRSEKRSLTVAGVFGHMRENYNSPDKHKGDNKDDIEERDESDEELMADGSTIPSNKRPEGVARQRTLEDSISPKKVELEV